MEKKQKYKQRKPLVSRNPYNGEVRKQFKWATEQELDQKIKFAEKGFERQMKRTLEQRAAILKNMSKIFKSNRKELSQLICFEMGKPITEAQGEVDKTISFLQYFGEHIQPLKPHKVQDSKAKIKTEIVYKPLGIIYLMVPFNFPLQSGFRGGIAALLAGNSLLVKTTSCCPALAEFVQKIVMEAGFDGGEYVCIHAPHQMIDKILKHPWIAGVSFTGSTKSGSMIAEKAGKYLKKNVMQLGGNDPFVVLKDADLDLAVKKAVEGRTRNCGQVCTAPKRFIIQDELYDRFKEQLIQGLKKVKYGDPMDKTTQIGPLAKESLYGMLDDQLKEMPKGYKIIWKRQDVKMPFYPITVVQGNDEVYDEQMFGPIYTLYRAKDEKDAIRIANMGNYGLGGEVFSKDHGQEVIDQIRCGMGFVNEYVKSDYCYPSGGVGKSGYGRECGQEGYKEFTNIKVHYIC